ncbi:hypothetical protein, partial [uncultured Roseovarius sp.]|uniref:hypothetical protein n=1 Tax=uncultured Roseovarius sp. TaxID=293344 RepID=UPI00262E2846
HGQAAQRSGIPSTSAQKHRPDRPKTDHALTFISDHSMGADHAVSIVENFFEREIRSNLRLTNFSSVLGHFESCKKGPKKKGGGDYGKNHHYPLRERIPGLNPMSRPLPETQAKVLLVIMGAVVALFVFGYVLGGIIGRWIGIVED